VTSSELPLFGLWGDGMNVSLLGCSLLNSCYRFPSPLNGGFAVHLPTCVDTPHAHVSSISGKSRDNYVSNVIPIAIQSGFKWRSGTSHYGKIHLTAPNNETPWLRSSLSHRGIPHHSPIRRQPCTSGGWSGHQ
jgi:hypothetical protein